MAGPASGCSILSCRGPSEYLMRDVDKDPPIVMTSPTHEQCLAADV